MNEQGGLRAMLGTLYMLRNVSVSFLSPCVRCLTGGKSLLKKNTFDLPPPSLLQKGETEA